MPVVQRERLESTPPARGGSKELDINDLAESIRGKLDPFGRWPLRRSAIAGLGGPTPAADLAYAFSSRYAYPVPGPACLHLQFDGLSARQGELRLVLREHLGGSPRAREAQLVILDLANLARAGGDYVLPFTAKPGAAYGLDGTISKASHASAANLTLTLEPFSDGEEFRARLERGRQRVFGRVGGALERAGLLAEGVATLARPTSQSCTAAQFDEPDYLRALEQLGEPFHRHRKQWEFVFILRALETLGVLLPGARGLGFAVGAEPLPAAFAARGCHVLATDLPSDHAASADWRDSGQHSDAIAPLARPALCTPDVFGARVEFRPVDMNAIPADLRGFDFCWSACAFEHLGSIRAGLRFVKRAMTTLRPGGVAVHTTELNLASNTLTVDHARTVLFRRRDLERLAIRLQAQGCEVAPFNYDLGDTLLDRQVDLPPYGDQDTLKVALRRYVSTSFGLIVRRACG